MKIAKLVAVFFIVFVFSIGVRAGIKYAAPSLYARVWGTGGADHQGESTSVVAQAVEVVPPPADDQPRERKQNDTDVFATGAVRRGRRVLVQMSDGTVRTHLDNEPGKLRLTKVTSTYADWDGKRYWFKPSRAVEGVAADRRPLDAALVPPSPNGRAPVDGGETPSVASGPLAGSWETGADGVARLRNPETFSSR